MKLAELFIKKNYRNQINPLPCHTGFVAIKDRRRVVSLPAERPKRQLKKNASFQMPRDYVSGGYEAMLYSPNNVDITSPKRRQTLYLRRIEPAPAARLNASFSAGNPHGNRGIAANPAAVKNRR
jgi:hypothetical protein